MNINPIFNEAVTSVTKNQQMNTNSRMTHISSKVPENTPQRKTRSDKTHDIRICVTPYLKAQIRLLAKDSNLSTTKFATKLLVNALSCCRSLPEYPYKDTKLYVHVKPAQIDYKKVFELAINNDVSEREAATRLVLFSLKQRGVIM